MADFKPVTLYKDGNTYLCETQDRLDSFTADGWSKTKPKSKAEPATESEPEIAKE